MHGFDRHHHHALAQRGGQKHAPPIEAKGIIAYRAGMAREWPALPCNIDSAQHW